ncbi:MAG: single-stranded DNA-binding protein [Terracoccus sp.]
MNEIRMIVHGNVVGEPVQRTTRTGGVFVTFSVASTPRRRTPDGRFVDRETTFVDVICFDALAANVVSSLHKGQPVTVEGDFSSRRWLTADGHERESPQVEASHIGHDLRRGRAAFERVSKAAALGQDRSGEPEVLEALAAMHDSEDPRPSWVDANGEVVGDHPGEEPTRESGPSGPSGPLELGDPETDPYRVADEPAA